MLKHKYIKIGKGRVEAISFGLTGKNLIVLRGSRGYIMCGYLNLRAAEKFRDVAVKITGVSTIDEAVKATVASCTSAAKRLGIRKGQKVIEVLKRIA